MIIRPNFKNKEWIDEMYCPVCGNLAFKGKTISIHKSSTIKVVKDDTEKHSLNITCKNCGSRLGIDLGQPKINSIPIYSSKNIRGTAKA